MATTLASPVPQKRQLATWGGGTLANGCHFMSTADIFRYKIDSGFAQSAAADALEDSNQGSSSMADWVDPTAAIHLGTFTIDFVLDKKEEADDNYNFFEYLRDADANTNGDQPGWAGSSTVGAWSQYGQSGPARKQEMVTVCFYKNAQPAACSGTTYQQEVEISPTDLPTTSGTIYSTDTTDTVTLNVRKVLGVSSKCGGGDSGYQLTGSADDIFVWSQMDASADLAYDISIQYQDAYGSNVAGSSGLAGGNEGSVKFTVAVSHAHKVHDLLFIEGKTTATDLQGTFASDQTGEALEFTYNVGFQSGGGFTRDEQADVTSTCTTAFTVDAQGNTASGNDIAGDGLNGHRDAHWHCFRPDASNLFPTKSDGAGGTNGDGSGHNVGSSGLATLNTAATVPRHSSCTAKLTVSCDNIPETFSITGKDQRTCVEGNAYTNETDGAKGHMNETDCAASGFFSRTYSYAAYSPIEIDYEAAIVQAVRLRSARAYPKGADTIASGTTVTDLFGSAAATTTWECGDESSAGAGDGDCSTEDPYKVLYVDTGTSKISCDALESVGDPNDGSRVLVNGVQAPVGGAWTQSCTVTGASTVSTVATPQLDSTATAILPPPAGFPESYVFAAVSFSHTTREQTVKVTEDDGSVDATFNGDFTNASATSEEGAVAQGSIGTDAVGDNARRLRSAKMTIPSTTVFQLVEANQHLVQ